MSSTVKCFIQETLFIWCTSFKCDIIANTGTRSKWTLILGCTMGQCSIGTSGIDVIFGLPVSDRTYQQEMDDWISFTDLIVPCHCFKLISLRGMDVMLNTLGRMRSVSAAALQSFFIILLLTSPLECCCKSSASTLGSLKAWVPSSRVNFEFYNIFANLERTQCSFTFKQDSGRILSTNAKKRPKIATLE